MSEELTQIKAAIKQYTIAIATNPTAENYANLGSLYAMAKQWQKAIAYYQKAIYIEPKFAGAYRNLARIFDQIDQTQIANKYWYKALKLEPNWAKPEQYLSLGKSFLEAGKKKLALHCYLESLKLKKDLSEAYTLIGELLVEYSQDQTAIKYYQKAIKYKSNSWENSYQLAKLFAKNQEWEKAIENYQTVIKLNPKFINAYQQLGIILLENKRYSEALENYRQAIKWCRNLGTINEQIIKNYAQALNQYHETNAQDYYELGKLYRSQSLYHQAIQSYQKAIELSPDFVAPYIDLQYTRIPAPEILESLMNFYRQLLTNNPHIPIAWGNLGDCLSEQGKIDEALECYQKSSYEKAINTNPQLVDFDWKPKKELPPDFIIIGAAKCGTSSLYHYLSCHPQILVPHKKELNFFQQHFEKGIDWYLSQFPSLTDRADFLTGEASPNYFDHKFVPRRIFNLFPQVKLIVLLRNPVERAISWHYHKVNTGLEKLSLDDAISREIENLKDLTEEELINLNYKNPNNLLGSLYFYRIKKWLRFFKQEQLLIIKSEDLYTNPSGVMAQTFEFLGLPHFENNHYPKCNPGSYNPLDNQLKITLNEFFQPHNQKLEKFLKRKFNWE